MKSLMWIIVIPSIVLCQGHVLSKGEKGILVGGQLALGKLSGTFVSELGITPTGTGEVGLAYSKTHVDENGDVLELIIPFVRFHPGKDKQDRLLAPFASFAYTIGKSTESNNLAGFQVVAGVSKKFDLKEDLSLMPTFAYAFSFMSTSRHAQGQYVAGSSGIALRLPLLFKMGKSEYFELYPGVSISQYITVYSIGAAFVFGLGDN